MANTLTRKIQVVPVGDKEEVNRVYNYIRDGMYSQYLALNRLMSELVVILYHNNRRLDEVFNEERNKILSNHNTILDDIVFPVGCDSKSLIISKVKSDFTKSIKNGLARGEASVINYKRTNPLLIRGRDIKLYHNYDNILQHLDDKDLEVFIKFVNNINFKIIFGNPHKSKALRAEIYEILNSNYQIKGSSIQIDNNKSNRQIK